MEQVIVGQRRRDNKKKGRKVGKGIRKATRSRWRSYAGIIGHSEEKKQLRVLSRKEKIAKLRKKRGGFRNKRAMLRAAKFGVKQA